MLLCAGALQSPQLLQLSGIGPGALLAEHGIETVHDAPGVGENLQDHLQIRLTYEATIPTTNDRLRTLPGKAALGAQWLLRRSGPLAVGINQGGCFTRVVPSDDPRERDRPDIQYHVSTLSADMAGGEVHPFSGFTLSVCQLRPESRGRVRIRCADPARAPSMVANYLDAELDRTTVVAAVRHARAIAASNAMRPLVRREVRPGPEVPDTDEALLDYCRGVGATIFHPTGTARMGADGDPGAVLDPRLRVRGVEALRVVDCSAMPTVPSGNTNAAAVMMGEKAARMIREDAARRACRPRSAPHRPPASRAARADASAEAMRAHPCGLSPPSGRRCARRWPRRASRRRARAPGPSPGPARDRRTPVVARPTRPVGHASATAAPPAAGPYACPGVAAARAAPLHCPPASAGPPLPAAPPSSCPPMKMTTPKRPSSRSSSATASSTPSATSASARR